MATWANLYEQAAANLVMSFFKNTRIKHIFNNFVAHLRVQFSFAYVSKYDMRSHIIYYA